MAERAEPTTDAGGKRRKLTGIYRTVIFGVAILMSVFQLYYSTFGIINTMAFRSGHLMFAMVLIFGVYPFRKKSPHHRVTVPDVVLSALALTVGIYIIDQWRDIVLRMGDPTRFDIILGIVATLLTLEIARRTTGFALASVATGFLLYAYFGPYFPGELSHVGFPLERLVSQLYTSTEGIYGMPLGVMTNYVFLFILFATFLHKTGAGDFFIRLAYGLTGRFRGGPAKTAIVASGMMGTISGSATANVVTTGAFTIPLMKRLGYKPETAGGIEVASSVGGQLMPPIMGAGAFIMAEWTGTPYIKIISMAAIPAVMYYFSVGFYTHIIACKLGMKPLPKDELPKIWPILKDGFHFLIPLFVLIAALVHGYTPMMSAIYAIVTMVGSSYLRKKTRMSLRAILDALGTGAINAVLVSASLTCAGIIMCVIGLTGIGLKFSAIVLKVSGGNIGVALFLVALASLFLGMELPITAAYIMCAVLAVPALKTLGIPLLTAHMIVFWFSMDSTVTPPVCISAYAAAGIAGGHPMKTGLSAWKMAKGLYIIPVLMAYTKLLTGNIVEILTVAIPALLGILSFNIVWEGFFMRKTYLFERCMLLCAMALLFYAHIYSYISGMAIFAAIVLTQRFMGREKAFEGVSVTTR
jgi:TRAP transporter 4TM/12TM fusion protein